MTARARARHAKAAATSANNDQPALSPEQTVSKDPSAGFKAENPATGNGYDRQVLGYDRQGAGYGNDHQQQPSGYGQSGGGTEVGFIAMLFKVPQSNRLYHYIKAHTRHHKHNDIMVVAQLLCTFMCNAIHVR